MGLGGNLGDPVAAILSALRALDARSDCTVVAVSSLYRNPPMTCPGRTDVQPDYVNAVARVDTVLVPEDMLDALLALEAAAGRIRGDARWQARTLDLDLLLHGDQRQCSERLTLPHPGAHERAFVIHPLAEIAPQACIPGQGRAGVLAAAVDAGALVRIAPPPRIAGP